MAIKPIELLIRAKDEASGILSGLKGQLMAVAGIIAAYFGIDAYKDAVHSASEFEAAMSRVKAATGATTDEMAALKKAAEDAAAGSSYSAVESAGALENLAKAGLEAKDAISTLPAVLALAQAGDVGLADSADYISKAIQGMGLQFADAARVADVLAQGANASSTNVKGLAEALSYSAPVAKSLGVSLESTVAMIGQFANAGIDASRAGTALNSIMSQFQDPGSKFRGELAAAGITTGNFEEALHQLAKAGAIGGKAILSVGQEAGPALVGLLNKGMPALDELKGKLIDSAGSAQKFAEVMKNNLSGSMGGLASAWEAVQLKLGTPVLPVLKDAVDQLAGALKAAVADGTAQRFGEAIAAAFQSGAKWAKDFVAQINFTQISADLRAFADKTGEVFTQVGEYASTAGNSAKLAYGVMSAGANTVLAVVYLVGEAFAGVASNIQSGLALLLEGLSKVTFGGLSASFKAAAEEVKISAGATWAASEAFAKKSEDAFASATKGAETARAGWDGLTNSTDAAGKQASASEAAFKQVAQTLTDVGSAAAASGQKTAAAAVEQKQAADTASAAVSKLRDEYKALVASGDAQGAAEKIKEINKALQATVPASKEAAEKAAAAAKAIADAFAGLGVTSQAELKRSAESARIYYDRIKGDASSTAVDIANAFKATADAAIKANNGIAPSWVTAEAAARGYTVQVDSAGKATLAAAGQGVQAGQAIADAMGTASGAMMAFGATAQKTTDELKAQAAAVDAINEKYGQGQKDKDKKAGKAPGSSLPTSSGDRRAEFLAGQDAQDLTMQFSLLEKVQKNTLSASDLGDVKAFLQSQSVNNKTNQSLDKFGGAFSAAGSLDRAKWERLQSVLNGFVADQERAAQTPAATPATAAAPASAPAAAPAPAATAPTAPAAQFGAITINIGGVTKSVNTDAAGAATLQQILQQLADARSVSSR